MDSIIIITRYFLLFRKNESAVDEDNDLKSNANKVCTSNLSQSKTDDSIDSSKKPDEDENVADIDNLCRIIDDNDEKISPNKECFRNKDDETKQKTIAPYVEESGTKHLACLSTQASLNECKDSPNSRSSSPITDSSPKDLSVGNKARNASTSPETSQSNTVDMSILPKKISTIKSIDNFDACKYTHLNTHTHTHTYNALVQQEHV